MQWVIWTVLLGVIVCIERVVFKKKGAVKIDRQIVKARSPKNSFKCGTKVVVVNVDGSHVVVEQM